MKNAKAYAALIGAIATGLIAHFGPDTEIGGILTAIAIIATAVGTWAVENAPAE